MRTNRTLAAAFAALALISLALALPAHAQTESALAGDQSAQEKTQEQISAVSQEETLARLVDYLNEITTLQARFVQISSNGAVAEGDLYLDRPGRLRFEYDPPHPALLIANGVTLLYYDRELEQATFLPLWETPLWFLIREDVDIDDGVEVLGVARGPATIRVTLQLSEGGEEGLVTLVFSDQPVSLHSWEVRDAQGITTQVALINPQLDIELDRSLFEHGDLQIHFPKRRNN